MKPRVKFAEGSATDLEILAIPWGGPFNGRDTDGEYFSAKTDLCLDWFPTERPLLYHHGLDGGPGVAAIGRVDSATARKDVDGWWVRAQLDESNQYFDSIAQLVAEGKLYASSGAMPHLVRRGKGGELTRWPWVELSLTPTPANLFATVAPAEVAKHYKSAGLAFTSKAELDSAGRDALSDADYAYIDGDGGRHLPINDAAHVRAALARFNQTKFESDAAKEKARKKILAAAKKFGVDVSEDFAGGKAAGTIPAIGDDGDAPEGSLEDLLQDLTRALNAGSMFASAPFGDAYCYPVATFLTTLDAGYTIVKVCAYDDDEQPPFYRVEFSIGPDLEPVLGASAPYDLAYIPAIPEADEPGDMGMGKSGTPLDATPLVLAAELARNLAAVVAARTKDVQRRRVKSGRVLSSANRQRLQALADAMKAAQGDLEALLTSTDPPAKASADVLRRLELRHRTLAMQERS